MFTIRLQKKKEISDDEMMKSVRSLCQKTKRRIIVQPVMCYDLLSEAIIASYLLCKRQRVTRDTLVRFRICVFVSPICKR